MSLMSDLTTEVLIVGAGPCGITLANLLGTYGVPAVIIDADAEIYPFPRAVGIDDESLRTFQSAGVVDALLADIVQNTPIRYYTSWGRLIAHVEPSVRPFGWPRRNNFLQPLFEATLRDRAQRHPSVTLQAGWRLAGYQQDEDGVSAEVTDAAGTTRMIRARYLAAADGGRSIVRRIAGIEMTGSTAPSKWLVVDVADDQLDAPYSAVYCDPERPVLTIPLPYRHRRFEFKVSDTDDESTLTDPGTVLKTLLAPRYGRTPLPTVLRSVIYLHHSRTAERFADRRVFLVGDAAHLQPPFFGQGMNSGIRDATNLAWKLAFVLAGRASEGVLTTYDTERREHARPRWSASPPGSGRCTPRKTSIPNGPATCVPRRPACPGGARLRPADEVQAHAPLRQRGRGPVRGSPRRRRGGADVHPAVRWRPPRVGGSGWTTNSGPRSR